MSFLSKSFLLPRYSTHNGLSRVRCYSDTHIDRGDIVRLAHPIKAAISLIAALEVQHSKRHDCSGQPILIQSRSLVQAQSRRSTASLVDGSSRATCHQSVSTQEDVQFTQPNLDMSSPNTTSLQSRTQIGMREMSKVTATRRQTGKRA